MKLRGNLEMKLREMTEIGGMTWRSVERSVGGELYVHLNYVHNLQTNCKYFQAMLLPVQRQLLGEYTTVARQINSRDIPLPGYSYVLSISSD